MIKHWRLLLLCLFVVANLVLWLCFRQPAEEPLLPDYPRVDKDWVKPEAQNDGEGPRL
jgi:hypothetical protein